MRLLAPVERRLLLIAWVLFAIHFATNLRREHYPAMQFAEHGDFRCDDYLGLHPDIFLHTDGHAYINNQVTTSLFVAVPLFLFDPLLDRLEAHRKRQLAANPAAVDTHYDTKYPLRQKFFAEVRRRGLDLRFGAVAAITATLLMAPLSALMVTLMFGFLRRRGAGGRAAFWLAVVFGFGTPLFFRTGHVNHNLFVMYAAFPAFLLLERGADQRTPLCGCVAGLLAGLCLAIDYSGVIALAVLAGYALAVQRAEQPRGSIAATLRGVRWFVLGTLPPIVFLLFSQWWMFGSPWLPAQYWMTDEHMREANFTGEGFRGFTFPELDLLWKNLFDPAFGLYTFAPLLALALIPAVVYRGDSALLWPRRARRFSAIFLALFLLFCSANQYARMQWNTGFRYLVPLLPFLFLASADVLVRVPRWLAALLGGLAIFHGWLLAMARDTVPESWARFFGGEGIQLPWLTVLRQTSADGLPGGRWLATAVVAASLAFAALVWKLGQRAADPGTRA